MTDRLLTPTLLLLAVLGGPTCCMPSPIRGPTVAPTHQPNNHGPESSTSASQTLLGPDQEARGEPAGSERLPSFEGDFLDDAEFDNLLLRLRRESEESILNPRNFVSDNADLEQILALIESGPSSAAKLGGQSAGSGSTGGQQTEVECPICYEELAKERTLRPICGHAFHERCLVSWQRYVGIARTQTGSTCCAPPDPLTALTLSPR